MRWPFSKKKKTITNLNLLLFAKVDRLGNYLIEAIPVGSGLSKTIFNIGNKNKVATKFNEIKEIWFMNTDGDQLIFANDFINSKEFEHYDFFKKLFESTIEFMLEEMSIDQEAKQMKKELGNES